MLKILKYSLVFLTISYGLTGCVSNQNVDKLKAKQVEQSKIAKEREMKQAELIEKVDRLEASVQEWQTVQPGVTRLVSIEKELNLLISQLNALVNEAETAKTQVPVKERQLPAKQKSSLASQSAKAPVTKMIYALQLLSIGNIKSVESAWLDMQKEHAHTLADYQPLIENMQVNGKMFYRIKVGEFSSRDAALKVCQQFKEQKISCFLSPYSGKTLAQFKAEKN